MFSLKKPQAGIPNPEVSGQHPTSSISYPRWNGEKARLGDPVTEQRFLSSQLWDPIQISLTLELEL